MVWTIEFEPTALKELKKLGTDPARRIVRTLQTRIATLDDPRAAGSALVGDWTGYWRYRIGDYRVVAKIVDERLIVTVAAWRIGGKSIGVSA